MLKALSEDTTAGTTLSIFLEGVYCVAHAVRTTPSFVAKNVVGREFEGKAYSIESTEKARPTLQYGVSGETSRWCPYHGLIEMMDIRSAQTDDLDAIRALLRSCGLPAEDLTPDHLAHFLVARDDGSLCGVVGLEPTGSAALLRSLAVADACRNRGLGARLTEAVERRAQQDGVRTLYLLTTTAAGYFRARGYEAIERDMLPPAIQQTEQAARLCPASATCMRLRLSTADGGPQTAGSSM